MNDSKPEMRSNHLNISEYNALRQEVLERIKLMNSQTTGAMTVIIALWAAGFTLMGMRFGIGTRSIPIAMGLCWGESITFFIVIPILSSMAVRSAENIRQIAAIGAYIRVFFESIPSVKGCAYRQSDWFFWESADSVASGLKSHCLRSNLSFHNREYLWLASTSAILWIVSLVSYIVIVYKNFHSCPVIAVAILRGMIVIIGIVFLFKCFKRIYEDTSADSLFRSHYQACFNSYLDQAVVKGIINDGEVKKL